MSTPFTLSSLRPLLMLLLFMAVWSMVAEHRRHSNYL